MKCHRRAVVASVCALALVLLLLAMRTGHGPPPVPALPAVSPTPREAPPAPRPAPPATVSIDAPLPPPSLPPAPAPAPEGPAVEEVPLRVAVSVRDLWNGESIAFFRLVVSEAAPAGQGGDALREEEIASDASGIVALPEKGLRGLRPADPRWRAVPVQEPRDVLERREFWAYRLVEVVATVHGGQPPSVIDPGTVRFSLAMLGSEAFQGKKQSPDPWNMSWMRLHGLDRVVPEIGTDSDGRHHLSLPRVRGWTLTAIAPGWRSATLPLPEHVEVEPLPVEYVLRQSALVRGRVVDAGGRPLSGLRVHAYTTRTVPKAELRTSELQPKDQASSLTAKIGAEEAVITIHRHSLTDDGGSFAVEVKEDGRIDLVVWEEGWIPVVRALSVPAENPGNVDVVLERPAAATRAKIAMGGKAFPGHSLMIADLTLFHAQPTVMAGLDADGCVSSAWFVAGREYTVRIEGLSGEESRGRFLVWNGQGEVELSQLPFTVKVITAREKQK